MKKINVLQAANGLGIGGIEKTLQLYTEYLNKEIFNVVVCGLYDGGVRGESLSRKGFDVYIIKGKKEQLVKIMREKKIDILHIHRFADCDPLAIEAACEAKIPIIVETNVFGRLDESSFEKGIDKILLISKMCAMRYKQWAKLSWNEFFEKHDVLYNPIDLSLFDRYKPSAARIKYLRKSYGLSENFLIIGRHGRPDPVKWGNLSIEMMPTLIKRLPNVRYLALGFPQERFQNISKRRLNNYFYFLKPTTDEKKLIEFLHLIDVYTYDSISGESFGIAIAEAMACGKPVVCNSTPHRDNAQVELIDHNRTGYISNNSKTFAQATAYLLTNERKRQEMGRAARIKVEENFEVRKNILILEKIYIGALAERGIAIKPETKSKYETISNHLSRSEIIAFEKKYKKQIRTCWGKPNYFNIFIWEQLTSNYKYYKFAKKIKDFYKQFINKSG